ncbi:MAG: hypothetical protein LAQ69_12170 [Acidobacteriia bacterium]|nr:hypothetical protein [Terriglobia bacterium]
MNYKRLLTPVVFVLAISTLATSVPAQNLRVLPDYKQIATIPLPGGLAGFDISWVDSDNGRYYLADRTATKGTGRIDVIDTQTMKFLYAIPQKDGDPGFVGNAGANISGPNGVVAIPYLNQLYVGDGDSTVKVVDLVAKMVVATISTGGKKRADELAYDPLDHIVMITNPDDSPAYVTFISTDTQKVLGTLTYSPEQRGLEQAVWNAQTKRFLMSVPAAGSRAGTVDEIDPVAMQMTNRFFLSCSPAGLALGPLQRTMTSCGTVIDGRNGHTLAQSQGYGDLTIGGDEIWFNPGDNRYYFGSTNVGVVDADTHFPLGFVTDAGGHSVAVDSQTNRIFVPVTGVGVKVFAQK